MAGNREQDWGKEKYFREGQKKQDLSNLFFDYLNLVERLKPKVAIAENVKGMLSGNAKGYVTLIIKRFEDIGYRVQLFLINSADCGVPQKRERVFFCALRNDIEKPKLVLAPQHKWVSSGEATIDLQELTEDEIKETKPDTTDKKYWPLTKKGETYSVIRKQIEKTNGDWSYRKLDDNKPSFTLIASASGSMHWSTMRKLTYREWKRLGSFPDDYLARTDRLGKYMIGMSVPPKMTEQVAKAIIEQWLS
jgi:DNA (cytosine-5)-methyltransferase 1